MLCSPDSIFRKHPPPPPPRKTGSPLGQPSRKGHVRGQEGAKIRV